MRVGPQLTLGDEPSDFARYLIPAVQKRFSFSQNVGNNVQLFNCADVGPNLVQLWVTDPGGNSDFCETIVTVQNNPAACAAHVALGGMILNPAGVPVGQVTVNLSGANMPAATTQAGVGSYSFQDLPTGGDFTIAPSKNIGQLNGVTAFDLAKINDHILGVTPFPDAWQVIAADANSSSSVTAADLVAIQSVILNSAPDFPNGTPSWRFVPTSHVFGNPASPWQFPQEVSLNNLMQDNLSVHFTGIKTGDVSGNANPAFLVGSSAVGSWQLAVGQAQRGHPDEARIGTAVGSQPVVEGRNGGVFILKTANQVLRKGEVAEVSFDMEVAKAWQFTLAFDPQVVEFQGFVKKDDGMGDPAYNGSRSGEGLVSMLWFGKQPVTHFTLKIKALADMSLAEALQISSAITPAAAWNQADEQLEVALEFTENNGNSAALGEATLLGCQPNPFREEAVVSFTLPKAGEARFSFFDASGKKLFSKAGQFEEGRNELVVNRADLAATGLIFIRMEAAGSTSMQKLVVLP